MTTDKQAALDILEKLEYAASLNGLFTARKMFSGGRLVITLEELKLLRQALTAPAVDVVEIKKAIRERIEYTLDINASGLAEAIFETLAARGLIGNARQVIINDCGVGDAQEMYERGLADGWKDCNVWHKTHPDKFLKRIVDAAINVVNADTYVHPILSRVDAVKVGLAELYEAVDAYNSTQTAQATTADNTTTAKGG